MNRNASRHHNMFGVFLYDLTGMEVVSVAWRGGGRGGGGGGDICPRAQGFRGRQNRQFAQITIALREQARGARAHFESC